MKSKLFTALLLTFGSVAIAAMSEDSIRSAIESQINQRHPSIPAGFWEGLGPEAVPVIQKMYQEATSANDRTFLIDGLTHFSSAQTGKFLENQVNVTENEVLKKKLLSAVIQTEGDAAFEFVEPYLKDNDGHIRAAVARGLMAYDQNPKIRERLEAFRSAEKTGWVLTELKKGADHPAGLQKTRRQIEANPAKDVVASAKPAPKAAPLPEKSWAGVWRGSYVTENRMQLIDANLILVDAVAVPMKWRVEFTKPKQGKQEWKTGDFTVHYFQTNGAHWIELRNLKTDTVFLAQKKVKS